MKKQRVPKPGDKRVHCTVCNQGIRSLLANPNNSDKVVDNGKTIPTHYCFGIDMSNLKMVNWICKGSGQKQSFYVYQPTVWSSKDGKPIRFDWKPEGWKPRAKK